MSDENKIALSIILRVVGGLRFVQRCLDHLITQIEGRPIEIIVPYDSTIKGMSEIARDFPQVNFVDMGFVKTAASPDTHAAAHELYDRRTAGGLRAARGEILALLEDYGTPEPDWCEQIIEAHKLPHGVIGGSVDHDGKGILNWAVYFIDFGRYRMPLCEGPVDYLTDINVSYKRDALELVREVWANEYNEVAVHWALTKQGVVLWQRPQIAVWENRGELSLRGLVRERFAWGRLFGCMRVREMTVWSRLLYVILSPGIPIVLLVRMTKKVFRTQRNRDRFLLSLPLIVALSAVWCVGEVFGYITGRASSG